MILMSKGGTQGRGFTTLASSTSLCRPSTPLGMGGREYLIPLGSGCQLAGSITSF
jgi:hypothetical protein